MYSTFISQKHSMSHTFMMRFFSLIYILKMDTIYVLKTFHGMLAVLTGLYSKHVMEMLSTAHKITLLYNITSHVSYIYNS